MSPLIKELGIDQLPADVQVSIALAIWDNLGDQRPLPKLSDEQRSELLRRDAELDADPSIALTWQEIRARIEGKL